MLFPSNEIANPVYGLRRGREWVAQPRGACTGQLTGRVLAHLALSEDPAEAFPLPTIDKAIELQSLLRMTFGWATEIRMINP